MAHEAAEDGRVQTGLSMQNGIDAFDDGDKRLKAFRRARGNTIRVRLLRYALPVLTLLLVAGYMASAFVQSGLGPDLPAMDIPTITAEDLTMNNPRYSGFTKDGGKYLVRAEKAKQDFTQTDRIKLSGIYGELQSLDERKTTLKADGGLFLTEQNILELADNVLVETSGGMNARLSSARIDTRKNLITSEQPVFVNVRGNTVRAQAMTLQQRERIVTFSDGVAVTLKPAADADEKAQPASPVEKGPASDLFAADNGPVDIAAPQLTVRDGDKRAEFSGGVRAVQGDAELVTAQLLVDYGGDESDAASGGREAPAGPAGFGAAGSVERIVAPERVRIDRRAPDGTVQSIAANGAQFLVSQSRALFTGAVVMSNGPDQRASAKTAEILSDRNLVILSGDVVMSGARDQSARAARVEVETDTNKTLLTGRVVVAQGENRLEGGRLMVDQAGGITVLTSPPGSAAKEGRVSARFRSPNAGKGTTKPSRPQGTGGGLGLASFRTDPNAPVEIEADQLRVRDSAKQAVFSGNVMARQGGFSLRTAKLTARYTGSGLGSGATPTLIGGSRANTASTSGGRKPTRVETIRADGKVLVTSEGGEKATGDWAEFDMKRNSVIVGGDVVLTQGKNVIRGSQLSIDMATGKSVIATAPGSAGQGWASSVRNPPGRASAAGKAKKPTEKTGGVGARGGRPSAVFFPADLQKRAKERGGSSAAGGGWQTRTAPPR